LLVVAAGIGSSGQVFSAPPTLTHLFPAGGQRGAKVTVTCTGSFTWPVKAWASGLEVTPTAESGKIEISIPENFAEDRFWIRLYNDEGASALAPFLIGSLPELEEKEPNNSPRTAQALTSPQVTINGVLLAGDVDGFAVPLEAGQTLVAAVDANARLGSPIDAILQIALPDGTVLAENHDDFHLDPRLAYTATRSGTYIVRLFAFPSTPGTNIGFHGAANCIYRLTLTTGRYITHAAPLAVAASNPGTVEVLGWNIPPGTRLPVVRYGESRAETLPELEPQSDLRIAPDARPGVALAPDFANAARIRLLPDTFKPVTEQGEAAGPLPLPSYLTGRLAKPGQADVHRIALQKGQTLVATVESQSLGLALDPLVQLADPAGAVVVEVDDTGALRDAVVVHRAAHDGEYRLTIRDRYRHGGDRSGYLLTVRLEEPDFELSAAIDAMVVTVGKPAEIPIKILRRSPPEGTVGPITIEAVGLPAGVSAAAVVSEPSGSTATEVKLTLTSAGPAASGLFRIVGKASQPRMLERSAHTPAKLGASLDALWLTVVAPKP
jgi:hypothetical protein